MFKHKSIYIASLFSTMFILSACQPNKENNKEIEPQTEQQAASEVQQQVLILEGETEAVPLVLPECKGNNCPKITVDRLQTNQFVLDSIVDQAIVQQLQNMLQNINQQSKQQDKQQIATEKNHEKNNDGQAAPSTQAFAVQIQPYVDQFLALDQELKDLGGSHQISLSVSPKILNSQEPLATVVLNTSSYLGGAHGSSSQTYFNFDLKHQKQVNLDQIILSNQKSKLNTLAYEQFKAWVIDSKLADNVAEYEQAWKFKLSNNFYLGKQGLILQYGEYEIGPYVVGLPRLMIPYEQLKGILKPEYLPNDQQSTELNTTQEGVKKP